MATTYVVCRSNHCSEKKQSKTNRNGWMININVPTYTFIRPTRPSADDQGFEDPSWTGPRIGQGADYVRTRTANYWRTPVQTFGDLQNALHQTDRQSVCRQSMNFHRPTDHIGPTWSIRRNRNTGQYSTTCMLEIREVWDTSGESGDLM